MPGRQPSSRHRKRRPHHQRPKSSPATGETHPSSPDESRDGGDHEALDDKGPVSSNPTEILLNYGPQDEFSSHQNGVKFFNLSTAIAPERWNTAVVNPSPDIKRKGGSSC
jgi:hypothetical protein